MAELPWVVQEMPQGHKLPGRSERAMMLGETHGVHASSFMRACIFKMLCENDDGTIHEKKPSHTAQHAI